jgi:hypothetical protein
MTKPKPPPQAMAMNQKMEMKKKKASLKLRWIHPSPLRLRLLSPLHKMQEKLCIKRVMKDGTKDLFMFCNGRSLFIC